MHPNPARTKQVLTRLLPWIGFCMQGTASRLALCIAPGIALAELSFALHIPLLARAAHVMLSVGALIFLFWPFIQRKIHQSQQPAAAEAVTASTDSFGNTGLPQLTALRVLFRHYREDAPVALSELQQVLEQHPGLSLGDAIAILNARR